MQTNFAYGSTPYPTWRRVMQSPRVAAALAAAITAQPLPLQDDACASQRGASQAGGATRLHDSGEGGSKEEDGQGACGAGSSGVEGAEYLVLGSSVGWMVLFAAATYRVRSRSAPSPMDKRRETITARGRKGQFEGPGWHAAAAASSCKAFRPPPHGIRGSRRPAAHALFKWQARGMWLASTGLQRIERARAPGRAFACKGVVAGRT
jgi:hypothetical protein